MKNTILTLIIVATLTSCNNSTAPSEAAPVVDTTKTDSTKCITPDSTSANTLTLTADTAGVVVK